jgi:hypothetical protein
LLYHAAKTVEEQNNPHIIEAFNELKEAGKISIRLFLFMVMMFFS